MGSNTVLIKQSGGETLTCNQECVKRADEVCKIFPSGSDIPASVTQFEYKHPSAKNKLEGSNKSDSQSLASNAFRSVIPFSGNVISKKLP